MSLQVPSPSIAVSPVRAICLYLGEAAVLWGLLASSSLAQPPGFSPDFMFDRLDEDGSGVIEPEEIENSPMRRFFERLDIDTSQGLTRNDLAEAMDSMRRRFEEGGGFGGRGGFGFGGRGGDGAERGSDDSDRSDRRRFWRGESDDSRRAYSREREDRGREGRTDTRTPRAADAPAPKPRVTLDLPQPYVPGDADRDGQISLAEWLQWKSRAALGEFLGLDRDGDGILTPRELSRAADAQPVDVARYYTVTPSPVVSRVAPAEPPPTSDGATQAPRSNVSNVSSDASATRPAGPGAPKSPAVELPASADLASVIAAADRRQVTQAERYFSLLDRDGDGVISESEWSRSRRIKARFEAAAVDLTHPMSAEQFVSTYVRLFATDESI